MGNLRFLLLKWTLKAKRLLAKEPRLINEDHSKVMKALINPQETDPQVYKNQ